MKNLIFISAIAFLMFSACVSEEPVEEPTLAEESIGVEEITASENTIAESSDIKCPKCDRPDFEILEGRGVLLESIKGAK